MNMYYRDNYRRVLVLISILAVTALLQTILVFFQRIHKSEPHYFATTTTGQIIPLQSLSMPVVTNHYLLQWASLAVRAAFNLDFVNYEKQFKNASVYFTVDGWKSFMDAMNNAEVMNSLKNKKLMMSAVINGSPVILAQEAIKGRYLWRVQMPLLVTYTSASDTKKSHFVVTLDIIRVPVLEAAKGIQIQSFSAQRE